MRRLLFVLLFAAAPLHAQDSTATPDSVLHPTVLKKTTWEGMIGTGMTTLWLHPNGTYSLVMTRMARDLEGAHADLDHTLVRHGVWWVENDYVLCIHSYTDNKPTEGQPLCRPAHVSARHHGAKQLVWGEAKLMAGRYSHDSLTAEMAREAKAATADSTK